MSGKKELDDIKEYVPDGIRTYPADVNTLGIEPEAIIRKAVDKETDYKNVKDVSVESVEAPINNDKPREWYENL